MSLKKRSKIAAFFFGERIPVDIAKLNYKEILWLKWNLICRTITNIFISLLYNGVMMLGWYSLTKEFGAGSVIHQVGQGAELTGYAAGHVTLNILHLIINKFTKQKTSSTMVKNENPIPKKSGTGIVFLIVTIVPLIIWFIGACVITSLCRKYKKANGSYETQDQKTYLRLQEQKVNADVVRDTMTQALKAVTTKE